MHWGLLLAVNPRNGWIARRISCIMEKINGKRAGVNDESE